MQDKQRTADDDLQDWLDSHPVPAQPVYGKLPPWEQVKFNWQREQYRKAIQA